MKKLNNGEINALTAKIAEALVVIKKESCATQTFSLTDGEVNKCCQLILSRNNTTKQLLKINQQILKINQQLQKLSITKDKLEAQSRNYYTQLTDFLKEYQIKYNTHIIPTHNVCDRCKATMDKEEIKQQINLIYKEARLPNIDTVSIKNDVIYQNIQGVDDIIERLLTQYKKLFENANNN